MQRNVLSPVPKTHDDRVCGHASCSPIYGLNLELCFEGDLSLLALHGKCLCQEFSNMWVHCVKTAMLVKQSTVHHQRTIALHNYLRVFRKYCHQFSCSPCFAFPAWKTRVSSILGQLWELSFLLAFFPKKLKGKKIYICFRCDHLVPERSLPLYPKYCLLQIMKWKPRGYKQCVQICLDREWRNQV